MTIQSKAMNRFNAISIKFQCPFFCRNGKTNPQIHTELQGNQNRHINLGKEEQIWRSYTPPTLKLTTKRE